MKISDKAEKAFSKLLENDDKIVAQLLFPRLNVDEYLTDIDYKEDIQNLVKAGVGGFCLFKGNVEETFRVIKELKPLATIPLLFSGDYENGVTMRHSGGTELPHAMALGKTNNPEIIAEAAKIIADESLAIGTKWIFSPVCDVNSNKLNPIINIRAYGEDTQSVSKAIETVVTTFDAAGVLACAKHFPGHGDTSQDSHLTLPTLNKTKAQLYDLELKPFQIAIENNVASIMVAHLAVPELDSTGLPASLSTKIITDLLKNELNFQGIVVTDALEMKAISNTWKSDEAVKLAINAGVDALLMPEDNNLALNALSDEYANSGFKEKVHKAVEKIIYYKDKLNLFETVSYLRPAQFKLKVQEEAAFEIGKQTIDTIGDPAELHLQENTKIAAFAFLQKDSDFDKASEFFNFLQQAIHQDIDFAYINDNADDDQIENFLVNTKDADIVVIALFYRSRAYHGDIGNHESLKSRVAKLSNYNPNAVFYFGNPYLAEEVKQDLAILTYSDATPSIAAAVLKFKLLVDY